MQGHWEAVLDIGTIQAMAYPEVRLGDGPILETARRLAEDPFWTAIEVAEVIDDATRAALAEMLRVANMTVVYCAALPILIRKLPISALDEDQRRTAVETLYRHIDYGYELGARLMMVCSGRDPGEQHRVAATDAYVRSLRELCAYAQRQATDYVMGITFENFDRLIEKKFLIGPTVEAVAIVRAVRADHPNIGLTIDLSHLPLLDETPAHALSTAGDCLVHAHIGNCILRNKEHALFGDNHPRFGIPDGENGVPEVAEFVRQLQAQGYFERPSPTGRPVLTIEVKPMPGEDSDLVLANAKRVWQQAWAVA
jgi:sugar phosphate isomerase/epimerase